MKLSLEPRRMTVEAVQPASAGSALDIRHCSLIESADDPISIAPEQRSVRPQNKGHGFHEKSATEQARRVRVAELDIDLPKIQGSIFLADFSHLLRGHG